MADNPTNLPFPRSGTYRDIGATLASLTQPGEPSGGNTLHAEYLLLEEFTHASVTAYQANQDRGTLLNLYLVLGGVLITAGGIAVSYAASANVKGPIYAVDLGLALAGIISFAFFARLLQLSRKYQDALMAMDVIKEFYLRELGEVMPHLRHAFRWRLGTLRDKGRSSGTTFFTGSVMAVIGSFYFGGASELLFYYTKDFGGVLAVPLWLGPIRISGLLVDAPVFALALALYITFYRRARRHRFNQEGIAKELAQVGIPLSNL